MTQRHRLHILDANAERRARLARVALGLGNDVEVYSDWRDLVRRRPADGIVIACGGGRDGSDAVAALRALCEAGIVLPVILAAERPATGRVVEGIRQGALDFLELPCAAEGLARSLARVAEEASARAGASQRMVMARRRIALLSRREREVLDLVAEGTRNKEIARALGISPRTVEIHRAKMMAKLRANHAAEVVRLRIEAHGAWPHRG